MHFGYNSKPQEIIKPRCTCAARAYSSCPVCVCVCYLNICSTAVFVQKLCENIAALALSALRRLRVQSDLLDGTAFKELPLVVFTKGLTYKRCRHFAPSYFLEIADPTST